MELLRPSICKIPVDTYIENRLDLRLYAFVCMTCRKSNSYTLSEQQRSDLMIMEDDYQHQLDTIRKVHAVENAEK